MTGKSLHIAKADFLVGTARFRRKRRIVLPAILILSIVWAVYLAPAVFEALVTAIGPPLEKFLMFSLPGFMRSMMFLVWMLVLVFPLSQSLQEIKVSQWEIILSHKVSTRDIMVGMFIGRIPIYGLIVLILAPLLVAPFAVVYKVSLIGQLIMYLIIFFVFVGALWLSTLVTTAIQAKLGESPRGNDIGKALTFAFALLFVLPMYVIMYRAVELSEIMGMNVLLLFPFTWGADLVTWAVISFNGISLGGSVITGFESIVGLNAILDLVFLSLFTLGIVALGLFSADRVFRIVGGARTEKVTTAGEDGVFLRGIKRATPGPFGIRLVTVIKDFTRKIQNTSGMAYGVVLSAIVPVLLGGNFPADFDPEIKFVIAGFILGTMMAVMSGFVFGGIGFMDSQDQLWIIRSAPNGAAKYIKARVTEGLLLSLLFSAVPVVVAAIVFGLGFVQVLVLFLITYLSVCGGMLLGTGVTANNPSYDDTKSKAFGVNRMVTSMVIMFTYMSVLFGYIFSGFAVELSLVPLVLVVPILIEGLVALYIGARRLSRQL